MLVPHISCMIFLVLFAILGFIKLNDTYHWVDTTYKTHLFSTAVSLLFIFFLLIMYRICIYTFYIPTLTYLAASEEGLSKLITYNVNLLTQGQHAGILGWCLLLLCLVTSIFSLFYLGDKDFVNQGNILFYFVFFLFCTFIMVISSNLLIIFISFELIFFPSIYILYRSGYVKKVDKTVFYLLIWTLLGSFSIFFGMGYMYISFGSLDFQVLVVQKFTTNEYWLLYSCFFIGFGIKIPIFPFHYWLTKVHVEAPAGFSMFLSGFLVKTALYCFYYVNLLFTFSPIKYFFIAWVCLCIAEASVKMWVQVDIKKLIAYATIQEMNMLLLLVLTSSNLHYHFINIFFLMHGMLSVYMFFIVDQIQKRAQTRNILSLSGFGTHYKAFTFYIWVMLIFYLGFPFTVKFFIEWNIGYILFSIGSTWGLVIFFLAMVFGSLGFIKCWFFILYGKPNKNIVFNKNIEFFKKDYLFAFLLIFLLLLLNILIIF